MAEILITRAYRQLPVHRMAGVFSGNPVILDIRGTDFNHATKVYINNTEIPATDFRILSATTIYVAVPSTLVKNVTSIEVIGETLIDGMDSRKLDFTFEDAQKATGLNRCIQRFLKVLLTTRNTDMFARNSGGGLLGLVGQTIDDEELGSLTAAVETGIRRTVNFLVATQARASGAVPLNELISSASLISMSSDGQGSFMPHIKITSLAGKVVQVLVA